MDKKLNNKDLNLILESLNYSIMAFQNYSKYPNEDFRKNKIDEIEKIKAKIRILIND